MRGWGNGLTGIPGIDLKYPYACFCAPCWVGQQGHVGDPCWMCGEPVSSQQPEHWTYAPCPQSVKNGNSFSVSELFEENSSLTGGA